MAYIIKKQSSPKGKLRNHYYLVAGYREGGKVKQKTLFRLGEYPTFDAYLKAIEQKQQRVRNEIDRLAQNNHQLWIRKYWLNELSKLEAKYQNALSVKQKYVVEQVSMPIDSSSTTIIYREEVTQNNEMQTMQEEQGNPASK